MPENQNIIKFITENEFDLIIGDPAEMLGPLISWKYDIPLSFNTRWELYGDAGEILTGESTFDLPVSFKTNFYFRRSDNNSSSNDFRC